jgi:Anaphase-promoting complex, cyclosome, subunit 4
MRLERIRIEAKILIFDKYIFYVEQNAQQHIHRYTSSNSECMMFLPGNDDRNTRNSSPQSQVIHPAQTLPRGSCFTSIQQRHFSGLLSTTKSSAQLSPQLSNSTNNNDSNDSYFCVRLCPSMDLIASEMLTPRSQNSTVSSSTSTSSTSSLLFIHRTLNWQEVASVVSSPENVEEDLLSTTTKPAATAVIDRRDDSVQKNLNANALAETLDTRRTVEWRPDGRCIAVAVHRSIHIYSMEGLLKIGTSASESLAADAGTTVSSVAVDERFDHGRNSTDPNDGLSDNDDNGKLFTFTLPLESVDSDEKCTHRSSSGSRDAINSLSWVHIGSWCEHKHWSNNTYNYNTQLHQQHYYEDVTHCNNQRWMYVLPPSEYHLECNSLSEYYDTVTTNTAVKTGNSNRIIEHHPTTTNVVTNTSINVLCVTTVSGNLSLYLHGRYCIATNIPLSLQPTTPLSSHSYLPIVASPDLTHYITATKSSRNNNNEIDNHYTASTIVITSLPMLCKHRQNYQTIATLYCTTMQHLENIRTNIPEIYATWKSALKPMDLKLDGLQKLLLNYGLIVRLNNDSGDVNINKSNSVRSLLVQYILSGHTRDAPTLSNAIDQFFTSVQMNDQLLQRMGLALLSAVAMVETTVRKQLVAPATAFVYEIDQLYGVSVCQSDLLSTETTLQLLHFARQLLLTINATLTTLIEARSRIRNFIAWLRSTGANIKAQGTAANSVQRENAKKRRVQESVVHKLLSYLHERETNHNDEHHDSQGYIGLTESILHLQFAETLRDTSPLDRKENQPPTTIKPREKDLESMNVPLALQRTSICADKVYQSPQIVMSQSIKRTYIQEKTTKAENFQQCLAITTRIGQGGIDLNNIPFGDSPPNGFYTPTASSQSQLLSSLDESSADVRQWLVVARQDQRNSIQLRAFPLTWTNTDDDEFDDDEDVEDGLYSKAVWAVTLRVPSECTVRDVAFYSDDGKSNLSTTCDTGTEIGGKEGRQSLGLLVDSHSAKDECIELWLVPYDDLEYSCEKLEIMQIDTENPLCTTFGCQSNDDTDSIVNKSYYSVLPKIADVDSDNSSPNSTNVLYARTRRVLDAVDSARNYHPTNRFSPCHAVFSGSRGIGAVVLSRNGNKLLEIFDMEDDEEEEEEEAHAMVEDES